MNRLCAPVWLVVQGALAAVVAMLLVATTFVGRAARGDEQGEAATGASANSYGQWARGPSHEPGYFPLAVWLQDPRNAGRYRQLGVNLYVALWKGPTEQQLAELKRQGISVICDQNEFARQHLDDPTIVGWMHGDEPDNAQPLPGGRGYGPPIPPESIVRDYETIRAKDPARPVLLNLGQGVAWDGWHGRGVRSRHPEDYPQYAQGGDIISFDIYPVVHDKPAVAGKLWFVARGVQRLKDWAGDRRVTWNCIECTRISNANVKPTPRQVKAEVWMSIIHGSRGLIYFCHQFEPQFIEAALLADDEMAAAVGAINRQVLELAPVLNSPTVPDLVRATCQPAEVPPDQAQQLGAAGVAAIGKRHNHRIYVCAVRMTDAPAQAQFQIAGVSDSVMARVLGEDRTIEGHGGQFTDAFEPHGVHLYEVTVLP